MLASEVPVKETQTNWTLRSFSIYTDFPSSVCARWANAEITKIVGARWRSHCEMWKLDSLTAGVSIKNFAANDAVNADILVVAVGSLEYRQTQLMEWLGSLIAPAEHRPGLLIGLLGSEADKPGELDWTVEELLRTAQKGNRNFIWRNMEMSATASAGWLKTNIEDLLLRKLAAGNAAIFC